MKGLAKWACALALTCVTVPAWAGDSVSAGRQLYEQHCRTCHGGSSPADIPIGPRLVGIVGARAGTRHGGVYSRAVIESGIVWDRDSLRGFLAAPRRVLPGAMMPAGLEAPEELERLLDFLELLQ